MIFILLISFIILLLLGIPIALSLMISSVIYFIFDGTPLLIVAQKVYSGIDSFTLLCIPGFMLAGNLMNKGGLTYRIIQFAKIFIGHIRGGLGISNVISSMIFAGISGTALADTASIGAVMIPSMQKEGYGKGRSVAISVSSSTVGPIIPPSLPMIIVGTLSGIPVGKLFIAGLIPGILLGLSLIFLVYIIARKNGFHIIQVDRSFLSLIRSFFDAFWAIIMTFVILYGILGGLFTPTEASIISLVYAVFISIYVYKGISWRDLPSIVLDSIKSSASIMILVGFASVFAWILSSEKIPQMLANAILGISANKIITIILINLLLIIIGMFMETISALLILFPTLLPVALSIGMSPIQFGVMMVLNLIIGLTTPPVGVCLFVGAKIGNVSLGEAAKALMPFLLCMLTVLAMVSFIPSITTFLPELLSRS